jgi:Putative peptidoglycan binding domain
MKPLHVFRWFMSAAIAALLPATIQTAAAHSMGGGGMGGGHGGMRMAPNFSSGRGFGHFDHRRDFGFRHHGGDRFFFRHHDGDRFFFRHQNRFFFGFDFAAFGLPWWYSYPYPYYDGDPYGYSSNDYGPGYDDQYWTALAVSVQSELARRGYYHGPIDGVIGSGSIEAIREFQAAQGLPVTGRIDPRLLKDLGVSYNA